MRKDLNKLLCEHERDESGRRYKEVRHLKKYHQFGEEGEGLSSFESTRYRYGGKRKSFSENLNPLYGQIRKYLGRSWDDLYSDLCKNFDKRSVINQHILQHLYDFIRVKTLIIDGEIWVHTQWGNPKLLEEYGETEYYVDPTSRIIKKNPHYRNWKIAAKERALKKEREEAEVTRWINDKLVLRKIDGLWYEFVVAPLPEGRIDIQSPYPNFPDHLFHTTRGLKVWAELTEKERKKHGAHVRVGDMVLDVFTYEQKSRYTPSKYYLEKKTDYYHVSKKSASHKMMKKAGII